MPSLTQFRPIYSLVGSHLSMLRAGRCSCRATGCAVWEPFDKQASRDDRPRHQGCLPRQRGEPQAEPLDMNRRGGGDALAATLGGSPRRRAKDEKTPCVTRKWIADLLRSWNGLEA